MHGSLWAALAALVALLPFAGVFTLSRVFYLRDLSYCFWDRHLWLRRSLVPGEWPLWDPYLAAGQSAAADALHQMFLLPVLAIRLLGGDLVGFNLWVALPYPLAALGVYGFLRLRFSPAAAALGAVTFAASGPVVSSGSFPNMSWAVAAMPWVLWAADRCTGPRLGRRIAALALAFAFQAAAGEPVTLVGTAALAVAMSLGVGTPTETSAGWRQRGTATLAVVGGLMLGALIASVQLLPMAAAVQDSQRPLIRSKDFWSLHPLMLLETIAPHLFGELLRGTVAQRHALARNLEQRPSGILLLRLCRTRGPRARGGRRGRPARAAGGARSGSACRPRRIGRGVWREHADLPVRADLRPGAGVVPLPGEVP